MGFNIKDRLHNAFPQDKRNVSHIYFEGAGCWKWSTNDLPANAWITQPRDDHPPTWNFCTGVFHMQSGPPAFTSAVYPNHEELDFVIDGEFNLMDANSHKYRVKKGDLVHNLRHMNVQVE